VRRRAFERTQVPIPLSAAALGRIRGREVGQFAKERESAESLPSPMSCSVGNAVIPVKTAHFPIADM
jgi:hypothetical protein